jgi:hypothetical protein
MRISFRSDGLRAAMGAALLALAAPATADHHMAIHLGGDLGFGYDDNVGNAAGEADAIDSTTVTGGLNLDYTRTLSLNTGLLLRGAVQGDAYEGAEGLSSARLLLMSRLSHRPTGGFYMPTFAGWVSVAAVEFDSALRDGYEYRGGVFVSEPLTTAVSVRLGLAALERSADDAVFEAGHWSASLNLDWQVLPMLTLYGGYQHQDGDVVSSGSVPPKNHEPGGGGGGYWLVDAPDDALDGQVAYRLEATTAVATLGFNVPLSGALSIDGQLRRIDSGSSTGETTYERLQALVSVLSRF